MRSHTLEIGGTPLASADLTILTQNHRGMQPCEKPHSSNAAAAVVAADSFAREVHVRSRDLLLDPAHGRAAGDSPEVRRGRVPSQGDDPIRVLTLIAAGAALLVCVVPTARSGVIPAGLAAEARTVALHGGVIGSCHGCATVRMQQLARRLVITRFADSGPGAVQTALCIVGHESGFNPGAISSTGDYGLPQMNYVAHHGDHSEWWAPARGFRYLIFDPVYAVGAMWAMSARGRDWSAWTGTYGRGMCR